MDTIFYKALNQDYSAYSYRTICRGCLEELSWRIPCPRLSGLHSIIIWQNLTYARTRWSDDVVRCWMKSGKIQVQVKSVWMLASPQLTLGDAGENYDTCTKHLPVNVMTDILEADIVAQVYRDNICMVTLLHLSAFCCPCGLQRSHWTIHSLLAQVTSHIS